MDVEASSRTINYETVVGVASELKTVTLRNNLEVSASFEFLHTHRNNCFALRFDLRNFFINNKLIPALVDVSCGLPVRISFFVEPHAARVTVVEVFYAKVFRRNYFFARFVDEAELRLADREELRLPSVHDHADAYE